MATRVRAADRLVILAVALTLLYLGRIVLMPLALALMLSLLLAPVVRALRRAGIARTWAVVATVSTLTLACAALACGLGLEVLRIAKSAPRYEVTVHHKLKVLDEATLGPWRAITHEASRLVPAADSGAPSGGMTRATEDAPPVVALAPRPVAPLVLVRRLLGSLWVPLQTTGIVLLVLTFLLLEHESVRDRFIRIAGAKDIRAVTLALDDAGARLSRYFVSQSLVNLAFGLLISSMLGMLRLPEAMLCGACAALLRFVPYVGVALAALLATALAFAVDPGWVLTAATLATFIGLDLVVGQLLEPHLYGHATGLSPLSVVIAAVFWSALWGPAGLLLSTPLTLCLLVAGRHLKELRFLELLLGNAPPLTLPQSFYQRALAGDAHEILSTARDFLRGGSPLSLYCDRVLLPALHLAYLDSRRHASTRDQQLRIRRVIIEVISALSEDGSLPRRRRRAGAVLEEQSVGQWLRQQREQSSGRWQGPLGVAPGSVVICCGIACAADDLAAELLVRLLRAQGTDARHFSPRELDGGLPPGADPHGVRLVFLVRAFPHAEPSSIPAMIERLRRLLPYAHVLSVCCPGVQARATAPGSADACESLTRAIEACTALHAAPSASGMACAAISRAPTADRSRPGTPRRLVAQPPVSAQAEAAP